MLAQGTHRARAKGSLRIAYPEPAERAVTRHIEVLEEFAEARALACGECVYATRLDALEREDEARAFAPDRWRVPR